MGLDVKHIQLTKEIMGYDYFLYTKDWNIDCNVSIENYEEYIQDIEDTEIDKDILIIKKKEDYDKIIKEGLILENQILEVFIGDKFKWDWEKIIKKYFDDNKIKNASDKIITIGSKDLEFMTASTLKTVMVKGVYYNEVGYQRKGMNGIFYNDYTKYFLWGNKEDFIKAYDCLDDSCYCDSDENTLKEMQEYFKENFLDNYIFGKSLLLASF
jgi:hypothetical protein